MRKYGLIGYPLGHSFSKKYFSVKFLDEHMADCSYENFPMANLDMLPKLIEKETDLHGFNVTIPYKSEIFRFLDIVDTVAQDIGAVNVVKIRRASGQIKLYGYNSDVTGIRETLLPYIDNNVRHAIVLGTGGSSKAVCYVLDKMGMKITRVSRNKRPGIVTYSDVNSELIRNARLIINTTPLGMYPAIDGKPDIDYSSLGKNHILFDLVYNPEKTLFLRKGEEQGSRILSGLTMLYSQAEKAWEIWNDDNI